MGHFVFKLPDVGEGTAEAEIVKWHVKIGDKVSEDQHLVDVMTDKATVEMTSPVAGKVVSLHGNPGEKATVGAPLAEFEVEGAGNAKAAAAPAAKPKVEPQKIPSPERGGSERGTRSGEGSNAAAAKRPPPDPPSRSRASAGSTSPLQGEEKITHAPFVARIFDGKPLASPAVRQRAHEMGVELQYVPGSGPAGRISHEDLDKYISSGGHAMSATRAFAKREGVEEIKIIGLRRKIAEKMQESKRRIPHFAYVEEVDVTELENLRSHLNANKRADQPKLTMLPFLMQALVRVLPEFPQVNARFDDEAGIVHRFAPVHIGIATQTANGLMVPVVHHAEALDIWQMATEVVRVAQAARDGKATREELTGSTITITSLGPLGGVVSTPVINYPEVAIVGPTRIIERPVVRDGQIVVRKMMNLSSSFDHRVVDGYDAAVFIQRIKALLEHPATLFMD